MTTPEFDTWIKDSGLSPDLQETITEAVTTVKDAAEIVGGVVSIVGAVESVLKIADFLLSKGGPSEPDRLLALAREVQHIDQLLTTLVKWEMNADWTGTLADLATASDDLRATLRAASSGSSPRPGLLTDSQRLLLRQEVVDRLRKIRNTLLAPPEADPCAYQQAVYSAPVVPFEVFGLPENVRSTRIDAAGLGVLGLPKVDPPEWPGGTPDGGLVWDHRRALPHILRTVVQLVAAFHAYDPSFRTTGRFREELLAIQRDLLILLARWFGCLAWTRDLPLDTQHPDSDFPESRFPNACDFRNSVTVEYATEHPEIDYWVAVPPEPTFSERRRDYALKVLRLCGWTDLRAFIDQLDPLLTVPTVSETVTADVNTVGVRNLVRTETANVAGATRTVKVQHVDWQVTINLTLQPQQPPYDYANDGYQISYAFYLESYKTAAGARRDPRDRVARRQIQPGGDHLITIWVMSPTLWVAGENDASYDDETLAQRLARIDAVDTVGRRLFERPLNNAASADGDGGLPLVHDRGISEGLHRSDQPPPRPGLEIIDSLHKSAQSVARNRNLDDIATAGETVAALGTLTTGPPVVHTGLAREREATIGCSLAYGPPGDNDGLATFRAWTTDESDVNVGALYLVVEETPPPTAGYSAPIQNAFRLPLNPVEYWYAAYSRVNRGVFPEL